MGLGFKNPTKEDSYLKSATPEFSCLVRAWNGEYTVREENLRDLQYSPDHRQKMQQLSDRLVHLRSLGEEETVRAILETLGSLKRPYLNPWEEKLLEFLEGYNAR